MDGIRVIDRRRVGMAEREFEERSKRILEVYGQDQEHWFRWYWRKCFHDRPDLLLVDEKTAVMTAEVFKSLPEYGCTIPTGTYFAKRWKRDVNEPKRFAVRKGRLPLEDFPPLWWMGEYTEDDDPKQVKILWREILIV